MNIHDGGYEKIYVCTYRLCVSNAHPSKHGFRCEPVHVRLVGPPEPAASPESSAVAEGVLPAAPPIDSGVTEPHASTDLHDDGSAVAAAPSGTEPPLDFAVAAAPSSDSTSIGFAVPEDLGPDLAPQDEGEDTPAAPQPDDSDEGEDPDKESEAETEEEVGPPPFELAVAPAPIPAFVSTYAAGEVPPPPARAALRPLPKAKPLSASAARHRLAVAGDPAADSDDEEPVLMKVVMSEALAKEIQAFIHQLATDEQYVGIAAFVVFALRYRLRVYLMHGTEQCDVLSRYAPWAVDHIDTPAVGSVSAISCRIHKGALVSHGDALHRMNHWVGGRMDPEWLFDGVPSGPSEEVLNKTEEEVEFHACTCQCTSISSIPVATGIAAWT